MLLGSILFTKIKLTRASNACQRSNRYDTEFCVHIVLQLSSLSTEIISYMQSGSAGSNYASPTPGSHRQSYRTAACRSRYRLLHCYASKTVSESSDWPVRSSSLRPIYRPTNTVLSGVRNSREIYRMNTSFRATKLLFAYNLAK